MTIGFQTILRILLSFCLFWGTQKVLFSQGNRRESGKGLFMGISFGPVQTQIKVEGYSFGSEPVSDKMVTWTGSAEVGYFFNNYLGLSTGINMATYKTRITLDSFQDKFNSIDSENETYELSVSGTDMIENQKISYLNVPVCVHVRLPITRTLGLFFQPGIYLAFPLSKNYTSNGTFTYQGYYSKYNALLEKLPQHGFPDNKSTSVSGTLSIRPFTAFVVASAGLDLLVFNKMQLALSATYSKSISELAAYNANDSFRLSPGADQINSFMGGGDKVHAQSIGLAINIRYRFSKFL